MDAYGHAVIIPWGKKYLKNLLRRARFARI
jgi:hypothetical protein